MGWYANWFYQTVNQQERFVQVLAPLSANLKIQKSISNSTTSSINAIDIEGALAENLPAFLLPTATDLAKQVKNSIIYLVDQLIYSEQFDQVWRASTLQTQSQLVMVLREDNSGFLRTADTGLIFSLDPIKTRLAEQLNKNPALRIFETDILNLSAPEFEILSIAQFDIFQLIWRLSSFLSIYIWPFMLLVLIGAFYLNGNFFRSFKLTGISFFIGWLITFSMAELANSWFTQITTESFLDLIFTEVLVQLANDSRADSLLGVTASTLIVLIAVSSEYFYRVQKNKKTPE